MTNSLEKKAESNYPERDSPIEKLKRATTEFIVLHYNLSKKFNKGQEPERNIKFLFRVTPSTDSAMGRHLDIDNYIEKNQEGGNPEISWGGHSTYLSERFNSTQEERDACINALNAVGGIVQSSYRGYEYAIGLNNNPTYTDSGRALVALFIAGLVKK